MTRTLREGQYRCRLCEKIAIKEFNSYIEPLTYDVDMLICRPCWRVIGRYKCLLKKHSWSHDLKGGLIINKTRMQKLLTCYNGHIKQDVNYRDCKPKEHGCLIHSFFMEMKKELKHKKKKGVI